MPFPKIPLLGNRVLAGHSPAPPANANPTLVQRFVSHLPLKVRAKTPEEGGRRPRAALIPNEVWSEIASHMDGPTWAAYRQAGKAAATNAAVPVKSIVVREREDLIPALTAFEVGGGITKLTAVNCGLGDAEAEHVAANRSITSLVLRFNDIADKGAQALAANPSITSVDLAVNDIADPGAQALAASISLTSVDLSYNHITDLGAQALAGSTSITSLDLRGNNIGDQGALALAANPLITSLYLSGDNLGPAGRAALEAVRGRFQTLEL